MPGFFVLTIAMKFTLISGSSVRFLAFCGFTMFSGASALAFGPHRVQIIPSYHNDVSRPLREMPAWDITNHRQEREAAENPKIPNSHVDSPDPVVDHGSILRFLAPSIPDADS